jgi:lipid A disaccharide synthetase
VRVFVGAGEASGVRVLAALMRGLRARVPSASFHGFGGSLAEAEGLKTRHSVADLAVNGIGDVVRHGVFLLRARARLMREMESLKPDLVLLVDYPGMNIALARRARTLGIPVHYVSPPQLWAYRNPARRLRRLRAALDGVSLQVLFPFEATRYIPWAARICQGHFFPVPAFEPARGLRLLLCPGSRRGVLRRNLPLWLGHARAFFGTLEGVDILVPEFLADEARAIVARAADGDKAPQGRGPGRDRSRSLPMRSPERRTNIPRSYGPIDDISIITDPAAAFARAGTAVAFPGTITLELFLRRIPNRVWAVLDAPTLWLGRRRLRGPHLALPSALANRAARDGGGEASGQPLLPEWTGTARDFRRNPPEIPARVADWNPEATSDAVHTVWTMMGSDQGVDAGVTACITLLPGIRLG